MQRKLIAIATALALIGVSVLPALAIGVRIGGVNWSLGSLVADGKLKITEGHPEDLHVILHAEGDAEVTCSGDDDDSDDDRHSAQQRVHVTASGSTSDDDQHSAQQRVHVTASGSTIVPAGDFNHRGVGRFHVETGAPELPDGFHCGEGTPVVGFVSWSSSRLSVEDVHNVELTRQEYVCKIKHGGVNCRPKQRHDDD